MTSTKAPIYTFFHSTAKFTDHFYWILLPGSKADPFNDQVEDVGGGVQDKLIHIRIQQRNGRKTLTTVQGLSTDYDLKKIVRVCKKVNKIFNGCT